MNGKLLNLNTIEDYNGISMDDKALELLQPSFLDALKTEKWLDEPYSLNSFLVVSFADLKKYIYKYRFHSLVVDDSSFSVEVTKSNLLHKIFKKDKERLDASINSSGKL